ncbi:MAG: AAA-like domain-containing protein [Victivallaceae bacterium]|jgi:hypothetical protein
MKKESKTRVNPGVHPDADFRHFTPTENEIIQRHFGTEFYVTNQGGEISLSATSVYRYFLIKPTNIYQEMFSLEREIIVVFSDYQNFEPRTLDSFEEIYKQYQELRLDRICCVLISKDDKIEEKIRSLLKNTAESQIIVPFSYKEIFNISDVYFFRNRFKSHFFSRDLFAYESALKKDLYFFGRSDLVHKIANRHRSEENSGLFGLRKTGKTSIIFGVRRVLQANDEYSVYIDCQNTGFYLKRWNQSLKYIIDEIKSQNKLEVSLATIEDYTEENCSKCFEKDLVKIQKKLGGKAVMLIFDEVERITFGLSTSSHWKDGLDFIHFWRTIRSIFQKHSSLFTFLIVSTNPKSVETATINGEENPIFTSVPFEYIPPFDVAQTKEMVERLSQIMGMNFDEIIYSKLTEDFGGHPFLIRMVCSAINKLCPSERPVRVDKILYQKGVDLFNQDYLPYIEMVITVLKESYGEEFDMIKYLALGDINTFKELADLSSEYTKHLLGYNILDKNMDNYSFKIESIKTYLIAKDRFKRIEMTDKERLSEISLRRNTIEPRLRTLVRTTLHSNYGDTEATRIVLETFGEPRKSKYISIPYRELFNPNSVDIYFEDLKKIILKKWTTFEFCFGRNRDQFSTFMTTINKYRVDAHAKIISPEEMEYFRICVTKIEDYLNAYF